jgi:hypothetical protein
MFSVPSSPPGPHRLFRAAYFSRNLLILPVGMLSRQQDYLGPANFALGCIASVHQLLELFLLFVC